MRLREPCIGRELTALALEYLQQVIPELPNGAADAARQVLESAQNLAQAPAKLEAFEQQMFQQYSSSLAEYQRLLTFEPFALDDVPAHFRQQLIAQSGQHLVSVNPSSQLNDRDATDTFIAQVSAVAPNAAGRSVVEWGVGGVVIQSFQQAVATAFLIIFLVLVCYLRLEVTAAGIYPHWGDGNSDLRALRCFEDQPEHGKHSHGALDLGARRRHGDSYCPPSYPRASRWGYYGSRHSPGRYDQRSDDHRNFLFFEFQSASRAASIGIILSIAISVLLVTSLLLMPILLRWFAVDQAST